MYDKDLLFYRMQFKKPITIQGAKRGGGNNVIAQNDSIILSLEDEECGELPELIAMCKMAEADPLLVTFACSKDHTEEEIDCLIKFSRMCLPLMDAWTYKTLRKYAPDVYKREVENMIEYNEWLSQQKQPEVTTADGVRAHMGYAVIMHESGTKVNMGFVSDVMTEGTQDILSTWQAYFNSLCKYADMEPDVKHYISLAEEFFSEIEIRLSNDGQRRFEIKVK